MPLRPKTWSMPAFRRHHDQITLLETGKLSDLLCGIPFENDSVDCKRQAGCMPPGYYERPDEGVLALWRTGVEEW